MRNVCNAWGYAYFNAGAFAIAAGTFQVFTHLSLSILNKNHTHFALGQSTLTIRTMTSFAINALIVLSTIHAQDFRDEVGDKLMGRRTIPIVWPEGSRIGILVMLTGWSIGLSWACGLAFLFSVPFCAWAVFIGLRFFRKRTSEEDQRSYRYYNVGFFNISTAQSQLNTDTTFLDLACCCPSCACPNYCNRPVTLTSPMSPTPTSGGSDVDIFPLLHIT
jgi:4-hydroxybenzoate polyprenyltransferase